MCGVAGIMKFGPCPEPVDEALLTRMGAAMAHRGPDGEGRWISPDRRLGLAHRRLAIIDLSEAAGQPMRNEDGSLALVFNGEIYNHAEIRRELEALGARFFTDHSDTEVILRAYEAWGRDCLSRFRGMFAFALWDERAGGLWLVRDRMGLKPLYYAARGQSIAFASEIKALLEDPDLPRRVDEEGFFHYLSFLAVPAPRTLFAGVSKLPCGTWLWVDRRGGMEERRWYDPLDHAAPCAGIGLDEAAEATLAALREAVRLRGVADVPVGIFLSGGIDSSVNAALFAEDRTDPVRAFSVGYRGAHPSCRDELPYARLMAETAGADYREILLDQGDLLGFLPEMARIQDEPIADPVCFPLYFLSKLARENGVPVCQAGEGADELFCGYPAWRLAIALQRGLRSAPHGLGKLAAGALRLLGRGHAQYACWLERAGTGVPLFWGGAEAFPESMKRRLLSPSLRKRFRGFSSWEALAPIRARFEEKAPETTPLAWMTYLDLNLRLPELLLMRVDKMSMAASLECRAPFLDHKLVELAVGLPEAVRFGEGELKRVLKKAVRGVIPDAIIDRKKQGFGTPVADWFNDRLGERSREELGSFCRETDFFDGAAIERLGRSRARTLSFRPLNFALWHRRYIG